MKEYVRAGATLQARLTSPCLPPPSSPGHGTRDGGPSRTQELDEAFATMVANAKRYNDEGSQVAADADVLGTAYADGRAKLFADAAKLEPLPRGGGR